MNFKSTILLLTCVIFSAVSAFAQKPVMTFKDTTQYNMGTFKEGEKAVHVFEFTNTGNANLVIKDIRTTCSCTASEWPKESIAPGETSSITVTFDTHGKNGTYDKGVNIHHNGGTTNLIITATVVPSPKTYPIIEQDDDGDDHSGHDHE